MQFKIHEHKAGPSTGENERSLSLFLLFSTLDTIPAIYEHDSQGCGGEFCLQHRVVGKFLLSDNK